ncbi:MoxR family ATPase [Diaminobutyricibacter tongyongensis]|uniref:MoxR family ATPase n=1 Tax=Leifsonia tongyongensis TaxID=1268043 RepID=A0A6L9XXR4_9MICO|nr:MoxR family ATPase [Diaminobutyricibacter tongyongensis]NEN06230.1 MoxR family ATPase [Diaminobutyricibacter tongyongensis]
MIVDPATTDRPRPLPVREVATLAEAILDRVSTVVVGMREPLELALATILAGGHVLFEDVPGLGKTLAARSLATAIGLEFRRLQCTPDLLPADITGSFVYAPAEADFVFRPGPVFTGLFLADEINRTSPKTQSALLEAMAEGQVTVEGRSFPLPVPFHVIATSNPIEYEGTYALPEAQLDRFMVRLAVGYPDTAGESRVLLARIARHQERAVIEPVVTAETLRAMQTGVEHVDVDPDIAAYCVALAAATRHHRSVQVGASPRGSQSLLLVARAKAVMAGRDFVIPDDVKAVAVPVLAHRLSLTVQAWTGGVQPTQIVTELVNTVAGPPVVGTRAPGRTAS